MTDDVEDYTDILKRTDDKKTWPAGPWRDEPDRKEWVDPETGLRCYILRGPHGSLCGYVGVPKGHPAWGMSYDGIDYTERSDNPSIEWWRRHVTHRIEYKISDICVHGGLTFAGTPAHIEDEETHWFGFDCAHAGDFSPKYDQSKWLGTAVRGGTNDYRDIEYVTQECAGLAKQLAAIK